MPPEAGEKERQLLMMEEGQCVCVLRYECVVFLLFPFLWLVVHHMHVTVHVYMSVDVHVCLYMKDNNLNMLQSLIASEGLTYRC